MIKAIVLTFLAIVVCGAVFIVVWRLLGKLW